MIALVVTAETDAWRHNNQLDTCHQTYVTYFSLRRLHFHAEVPHSREMSATRHVRQY